MKTWRVIVVVLLLELVVAGVALYVDGFTSLGLQSAARFSGRFSLAVFSIIFLFHNKRGSIDVILLGKPFHFFATAHGLHLLILLAYVYASSTNLASYRVVGGVVAYAFIFIMPFATEWKDSGKLNKRVYEMMEIIFQYYIWLIFFLTYLPRVRGTMPEVGGNYWEHVALLGWVSLMLGMKITSILWVKPSTSR